MQSDISISKFIISRRCNLPISSLKNLRDEELFNCIDEMTMLRNTKEKMSEILVENLYQIIPKVSNTHRDSFIQLKRDIYNNRIVQNSHDDIINHYKLDELKDNLNSLIEMNSRIKTIEQQLHEYHDNYLNRSRTIISELCSDSYFQKSLQLSGQRLIKKISEYQIAANNNVTINKKLKQTEETLLSYYYRMILKPSPFASFTSIIAHIQNDSISNNVAKKHGFCSISRTLIKWLENQCLNNDSIIASIPLRVNSTIIENRDEIRFFTRANETSKNMYGGEKYIKIKNSAFINKIVILLNQHNFCQKELIDELNISDELKDNVSQYINELINIGLLERKLFIPDLTIYYAHDLSIFLKECHSETSQILARHFHQLDIIEKSFHELTVNQRRAKLIEFEHIINKILSLLSLDKINLSDMRNYIYEDVGEIHYDLDEKLNNFEKYKKEFSTLSKILPILDDSVIERLSIYHYFIKLYPDDNTSVPLLEFYNEFGKLDIQKLTLIMQGKTSSVVRNIKALRSEWYAMLNSLINTNKNSDEININENWLNLFVKKIPNYVYDSKSSIYYVQQCKNVNDEQLMFNGSSMGYGALYSRFCSIFGNDNNPVNKALIKSLEESFDIKNMFDLAAVLGVNTNIHPEILQNYIEYPGCVAKKSTIKSKIYTLNDISIKADRSKQRLVLIHNKTNEEISFIPLNFLYPAVGPNLYRFLYLFTPFTNYKGGIWGKYLNNYPDDESTYFPRLTLGNIILDRQTWKFPTKSFSAASAQDNIMYFLDALKKWRDEWKIPEHIFYHQSSKNLNSSDWIIAMKEYLTFSGKAKRRKPHFLDFKNPLLIKMFQKVIKENTENNIWIRECLPEVSQSELEYTQEYLIQINTVN